MGFQAARCPSCAGGIQVPTDRDIIKCTYCGVDVVVREAIRAVGGTASGSSGKDEHTPMPIIVGGGGLYAVLDGNQPVTAKDAVNAGSFFFGVVFLVIGGVTALISLGLLLAGQSTVIQALFGLVIGALFLVLGVRRFQALRKRPVPKGNGPQ